MRAMVVVAALLAMGLAGCADSETPIEAALDPQGLQATANTGILRCVVVDQSIAPVEGVTVRIEGTEKEVLTDANGECGFDGLATGAYLLVAESLLYTTVTKEAYVEAGLQDPPVFKIVIERLASTDPFVQGQQQSGYINCGYSIGLSSPCIIDYTQLLPVCPGGCVPQLYGVTGDVRRFVLPIEDGWQNNVVEMTWTPSASALSQSLSLTTSFYGRTTSDTYSNQDGQSGTAGPSPLLFRMDMDPERTHPEYVGPEGKDDFLVFVNPNASDSTVPFVALTVEQEFELFMHTFYHGKAPEGWSFLNGDENPF